MKATSSSEVALRTRAALVTSPARGWRITERDRLYGAWVDNGIRLPFCFEYDNGTETCRGLRTNSVAAPSWPERSTPEVSAAAVPQQRPGSGPPPSFAAPSCRPPGSASGCSHPSSVTSPSSLRRSRILYLLVAKKNGKTELLAGIVLYLLCADGEEGGRDLRTRSRHGPGRACLPGRATSSTTRSSEPSLADDAERFEIQEVAYSDRWGMTQLSQDLSEDGRTVVAMGQGFASMSAATKEWLRLVAERRWRAGRDPCARWPVRSEWAIRSESGTVCVVPEIRTSRRTGIVIAGPGIPLQELA